jgi:NAD(P)-dependent dehydrogenase (short-subunit alcohol dehydrogenase family)
MIDHSPSGRAGTPDEVATVAAMLLGSDGGFITGSDFLDGRRRHCLLLLRRTRTAVMTS